MGQAFASGKHALGICDRCGFQYKLHELKSEVVDLNVTGTLVCPECWDPDQPQLQLGRWPINDPQAIRNPRPPQGLEQSRYGDALRYDFEDSVEGFSLITKIDSGLGVISISYGSVSHNSDSETITASPSNNFLGLLSGNGLVSPTVSVDTSIYDTVSIRLKINSDPTPSPNSSFVGTMRWRTVEYGSYDYSVDIKSIENWYQMGDPYHLLSWDMRTNSSWTGTVVGFFWTLFPDVTKNGNYEIDYVSFGKSLRDNP